MSRKHLQEIYGEEAWKTLREKGVEVPYMVKYDEGHGFGKEENRLDLYNAMMGFFAEHLKVEKTNPVKG